MIFAAKNREKIEVIHWTPDGENIFIVFRNRSKYMEKLINIKERKEVDFVKPKIFLDYFTWKSDWWQEKPD